MTQTSKRLTARARPADCCDVSALIEPRFFKALCDPNRIAILVRLAACGRACTVTEISQCCPVNISVVSRHLAMLREAGIVAAERRGKEVYYRVQYQELIETLRRIADGVASCCPKPRGQRGSMEKLR